MDDVTGPCGKSTGEPTPLLALIGSIAAALRAVGYNPPRGGCHMRLFRSLARELARHVGACLVVFATWALLDGTVLTQAPAQPPPAGGAAAPPAPPAGGRGRGRGELSPFAKAALADLRAPLDRLTPVTDAML